MLLHQEVSCYQYTLNPSYQTLYALRFLIGLFEAGFYPGIHYILGGWYTSREIGKRSVIFWVAGGSGPMFSGYLQAAAFKNLNGVNGLAGWRWVSCAEMGTADVRCSSSTPSSPFRWLLRASSSSLVCRYRTKRTGGSPTRWVVCVSRLMEGTRAGQGTHGARWAEGQRALDEGQAGNPVYLVEDVHDAWVTMPTCH